MTAGLKCKRFRPWPPLPRGPWLHAAATDMRQYGRLMRYAFPYWKGWLLIVVVTLCSSAVGLLQPWPMKLLVDHVLGSVPMPDPLARAVGMLPGGTSPALLVGWIALAGLLVFAIHSTAEVILTFGWIRVGQSMVYDLSGDLFARVQRRSLAFHSRSDVGDSMARITGDSWCVHTVVDTLLLAPGHALITMVGMLLLMWGMDRELTLLSLATAPFMVGVSAVRGRPVRLVARARREIESRLQSHVQRTLRGIPVVQAFAQEDREHRTFREHTDRAIRAQRQSALVGSISGLSSGLIATLGTGLILWVGSRHILAGSLTVGGLLVFLAYLASLQTQMKAFTDIYTALQAAGASIDRVMEILDVDPEVRDRPGAVPLPPIRGHVRLENVTFGYDPEQPVIHRVCIEARPGETAALVGRTGAGKSTLVSLIPRLFDPWEGRVLLDGCDLRDVQLHSLRSQVALVLQEPFLFPLSVAENIAYGRPDASRAEIVAAAQAANAHAFIEKLPEGYDTVIGERGATLSGGERQRLSIARALLKDAPVLILDEPTSALDAETEALLLEALARLMAGRTTFIIAHRLSTIRRADRIIVLEEGRVVEVGTHAELMARDGAYSSLHSYYDVAYKRELPEATRIAGGSGA